MTLPDIFVGVIAVFALIGFLFQLMAGRRYGKEKNFLNKAKTMLASMDEGSPIGGLLSGSSVPFESIVGHRLRQVCNITKSPAPPSVADLSSADIERDDSRFDSSFPNTLISLLLIAGLAGTLFSFKDIMGNFPQGTDSTVVIKKWMDEAYPAFGTAFMASLVGIGGTLLLLVVRAFIHNRRNNLFDGLDRFTSGPLYSRFVEREATDAETLIRAGQQLLQTAESFETSVRKIDAFPQELTTPISELKDATLEMRDTLKDASKTLDDFKGGFSKKGNMRDGLERLEGTVTAFADQTDLATGVLRDAVSGAVPVLQNAVNSMQHSGEAIASVSDKVVDAGLMIEQSVAKLLEGNKVQAEKLESLVGILCTISETIDRNQREWSATILPAIRAMTETAGKLDTSIVSLNMRTEALVEASGLIAESGAKLSASVKAQIDQIGGFVSGTLVKAITDNSASQQKLLADVSKNLITAGDAQAEQWQTSAATIDGAANQAISSHRDFLIKLEPALKVLPDLSRKQTELLAELVVSIGELSTQTAKMGIMAPLKKRSWKFWQR